MSARLKARNYFGKSKPEGNIQNVKEMAVRHGGGDIARAGFTNYNSYR